jgi:hypothetical protein
MLPSDRIKKIQFWIVTSDNATKLVFALVFNECKNSPTILPQNIIYGVRWLHLTPRTPSSSIQIGFAVRCYHLTDLKKSSFGS